MSLLTTTFPSPVRFTFYVGPANDPVIDALAETHRGGDSPSSRLLGLASSRVSGGFSCNGLIGRLCADAVTPRIRIMVVRVVAHRATPNLLDACAKLAAAGHWVELIQVKRQVIESKAAA